MIGDIVTSITDKELKKDYFYNAVPLAVILGKDAKEGTLWAAFASYAPGCKMIEVAATKILDKISSILQEDMTYQEGVVTEMLRYLKENQKLCLTLMTHIPNINEMIREFIIETILNSDIENVTELMEQSYHIPAKYSLEVYVSTIVTILTLWLKEGCIESPEELADIILEAVIIKVK